MSKHLVLSLLRQKLGSRVPLDASQEPSLWPHQIRQFTVSDVLATLLNAPSEPARAALATLLPDIQLAPGDALQDRPRLASATPSGPRITLVETTSPHPAGTSLDRNFRRYREGSSLSAFKSLRGDLNALKGDIRRGLIRLR